MNQQDSLVTVEDTSASHKTTPPTDEVLPSLADSECHRMMLLRKSICSTGNKCFQSLKKECLRRQSVVHDRDAFRRAVSEMTSRIETNFKEEMELMFKEENLADVTSKLDRLIEQRGYDDLDQAAWYNIWRRRPSGCVVSDTADWRIPIKRRQVEKLNDVHERLLAHNRDVMQTLALLRRKVSTQSGAVDEACTRIDTAYRVAMEIDTETLAASMPS